MSELESRLAGVGARVMSSTFGGPSGGASYRWRPWQPRDVHGFAAIFSVPGRRLCLWRTPIPLATINSLAALFYAAWRRERQLANLFDSSGTPFAFTLTDEHDRYVDFGVIMAYADEDRSAAISGLASDEVAGQRVELVKALAARGREMFGLKNIMVAGIPDVHAVAHGAGLPVKAPQKLSRKEEHEFVTLIDSFLPGVG